MVKKRKPNQWRTAAKDALKDNFTGEQLPSKKGYVNWPDDNLVPGIELQYFEEDLRGGAGDELRMKFCAVHSSSALAINSFAFFKNNPGPLRLLGRSSFSSPIFERKCPTGLGGTPPNLDIWIESREEVIAIESKLLEYFSPKTAKYSNSYTHEKLRHAEQCWLNVIEESKNAGKRNLDVAQLTKHYLGLFRYLESSDSNNITLLYLYWEPVNAGKVSTCVQHRKEIKELSKQVAKSKVKFEAMSYAQLWNEWAEIPELEEHVANLRERYEVEI